MCVALWGVWCFSTAPRTPTCVHDRLTLQTPTDLVAVRSGCFHRNFTAGFRGGILLHPPHYHISVATPCCHGDRALAGLWAHMERSDAVCTQLQWSVQPGGWTELHSEILHSRALQQWRGESVHRISHVTEEMHLMHFCMNNEVLKGLVNPKMNICWIYSHSIQNVDEFVSSWEQILRNVALHHLLTDGSSAVNGCRQNEIRNSW